MVMPRGEARIPYRRVGPGAAHGHRQIIVIPGAKHPTVAPAGHPIGGSGNVADDGGNTERRCMRAIDRGAVRGQQGQHLAVAQVHGDMLAAARAEATLGEICDALRQVWGTYTELASF